MKRSYTFISPADVKACRDLARIMIDRDLRKGVLLDNEEIKYIEYTICKFFDCMYYEFRIDFEQWIYEEVNARMTNFNLA